MPLAQADHLQLEIELVGPEPGDGLVGLGLAHDRGRGRARVLHGVRYRFQPQPPAEKNVVVMRAVADGEDRGVGGAGVGIDDDAVVDGKAGGLRELGVGHDADADDHEIGRQPLTVREHHDLDETLTLERNDANAGQHLHTALAVRGSVELRHQRHGDAREQPGLCFQHRHVEPGLDADGRRFEADVAAADHHHALPRPEAGFQPFDIGDGADAVNVRRVAARQRQRTWTPARGEDEMRVGERGAIVELHAPRRPVGGDDAPAHEAFDVLLGIALGASDQQRSRFDLTGEEGLRQRRAPVRQRGLVADQHDAAGKALLAQGEAQLAAGLAGADDDHGVFWGLAHLEGSMGVERMRGSGSRRKTAKAGQNGKSLVIIRALRWP